jgi:hypothetical protein
MNLLEVVKGEGLGGKDASDHFFDARDVFEAFFEGKGDVVFHEVPVEPQEEEQGGEGTAGLGGVPWSTQRVYWDEYRCAVEFVYEFARLSRGDEVGIADERAVVFVFLSVRVFAEVVLPNIDERIADLSCTAAGGAEAEWVAVIQAKFALELDDEEGFVGGVDGACAVERLDVEGAGLRSRRGVRDLTVTSDETRM